MEASKAPAFRRPTIMATATSEVALVPLVGKPVLFDREGRIHEHPLVADNATPSPVVNPFQMNMICGLVLVSNGEIELAGVGSVEREQLAKSIGLAVLAKIEERS